jgi:phenylacetate-CoA ligase
MINAARVRGWRWAGYEFGDKYIKITQNKRLNYLKRLQDNVNRAYLHTHKYDEQGFIEFIDLINKVKPKILRSYPDPLIFISNYVRQKKIILPPVVAITTTGNTLFNETREIIEKSFGAKIFDSYSCEGSADADECETHSCYHLSNEYAITEILDEKGIEVNPGERGLHITTDLWNYACPFIRYDTKDYLVKSEIECECRRGLAPIRRIDGRDNDILITADGKFLIGQNFTTYFKYLESIEQFQVVQNDLETLVFKLITNKEYSSDIEKNIIKYWKNYTGNLMKIEIELIDELPLRFSGKRQFLVRNPVINLYK